MKRWYDDVKHGEFLVNSKEYIPCNHSTACCARLPLVQCPSPAGHLLSSGHVRNVPTIAFLRFPGICVFLCWYHGEITNSFLFT